ncbi:S1/P1 nuclease [Stenotrophomonas sp. MMGLT7]|uniref:S1/P1 nuclease n=1 Tax=Stenotrophomonas sp. MMGLT7 TaxID=2901227 RepID=UPI001E3B73A1|nr:S1/P1 nuclease [Stenotrophomonas sp. MMGLT7]MCD7097591.1 S1/P1 nuclease [Stenotrophomonas sp. MMGLT7]
MKKTHLTALLCTLACALQPFQALAWGGQGHRLVAEIAQAQLTPQARQQVTQLLQGEPVATLPGIASWADELRESDPDLGKRSARWHYVNIGESDCRYQPSRDCADGNCVVEALQAQAALLADRSQPLPVRRQALKFVVHLVGDIHQPMHAGYARDRGGNDYQIQFDGRGSNLHSLWDSGMLRQRKLDDAHYLQVLQALPRAAPARAADAPGWAEASCRIAIAPGTYPPRHVLPAGYVETRRPLAEAQLRLAGDRLADLLNAAFSPP